MAQVLRLCTGGGVVVEYDGLTIEQARSLATHLTSVGEPAGCCWCVGVWEEAQERSLEAAQERSLVKAPT
jgi:hypothetical protein